jgi:hypothetical protein
MVTLGETVCEKLRIIYHTDQPWPECYKHVAQKFSALKQIMRKFYSEKTEIEILIELQRYSHQDILDAFEMQGNGHQ